MILSMAPEENMRMQCSQKGIDLIKSFEGFPLPPIMANVTGRGFIP